MHVNDTEAPVQYPKGADYRTARDTPRAQLADTFAPARPYVYRGTGEDTLTAFMDEPPPRSTQARQLSRLQLLDIHEAIDGPGPEWYRERSQP